MCAGENTEGKDIMEMHKDTGRAETGRWDVVEGEANAAISFNPSGCSVRPDCLIQDWHCAVTRWRS